MEEFKVAYVISDECTACGACMAVCPVEAISEGEEKYSINPDTCTDCGLCADECPFDAISQD
jgi:ferredoxin